MGQHERTTNERYLECFSMLKHVISQATTANTSNIGLNNGQSAIDSATLIQLRKMTQDIKQNRKQNHAQLIHKYPNYIPTRTIENEENNANIQKANNEDYLKSRNYQRLCREVLGSQCLQDCLFSFFTIEEVVNLRKVNHSFYQAFCGFCDQLLPSLESSLSHFLFKNSQLDLLELKKTVFDQIPQSVQEWIILDIKQCQNIIENILSRRDLDCLKQLKKVPQQFDSIFAPFCILLQQSSPIQTNLADGTKITSWHSRFLQLTAQTTNLQKFMSLNFSQLKEIQIQQILVFLEMYTLDAVQCFHEAALKLFLWTRGLVSLFYIDNIFVLRDLKKVALNTAQNTLESIAIIQQEKTTINRLRKIRRNNKEFKIYLDFSSLQRDIKPIQVAVSSEQQKGSQICSIKKGKDLETVISKKTDQFSSEDADSLRYVLSYLNLSDILKLRITSNITKSLANQYLLNCLSTHIRTQEVHKLNQATAIIKNLPGLIETDLFSTFFELTFTILAKKAFLFNRQEISIFKCQTKPSSSLEKFSEILSILFLNKEDHQQIQKNNADTTNSQKLPGKNIVNKQSITNKGAQMKRETYFNQVKAAVNSKLLQKKLTDFNIFSISLSQLKKCEDLAYELESELMSDQTQIRVIEDVQSLRLFINLLIIFTKTLNPLQHANSSTLDRSLLDTYAEIYGETDSCQRLLKLCFEFGLLNPQSLKTVLNQAHTSLSSQQQLLLKSLQRKEFTSLKNLYSKASDKNELTSEKIQLIMIELIERYNGIQQSKSSAEQKIQQKLENQTKNQNFLRYYRTWFVSPILNFLTLKEASVFARANQETLSIYKSHLNFRIHIEAALIKQYENTFYKQIQNIERKRSNYSRDEERTSPDKDHAITYLTEINQKDISTLKSFTKPSSSLSLFAQPVVELLGIKKEYTMTLSGRVFDPWTSLFRFMIGNDFHKHLQQFQVEVLQTQKVRIVEQFLQNNSQFSIQNALQISESLSKLAKWVFGVLEIHKFLRRYSLSEEEEKLMTKQEIQISKNLDSRQRQSYKILRYIERYPESKQEYEQYASQQLLLTQSISSRLLS